MGQLQKIESQLVELGYKIIAISPDQPDKLRATIRKHDLAYLLLSDSKMIAARAFGIAFRVDAATLDRYRGFGIDLQAASGEKHQLLPVPSVFVVGTDAVIRFRYSNPDYTVRIEPDALLEAARAAAQRSPRYEYGTPTRGVGTGKYYLGREIADPVSPSTVDWMERPARAEEQRPDLLLQQLELEPSAVVADVGAGSGYFSFRLSPLVPQGKVLAVDVQQAMLDLIEAKKSEQGVTNIETVLGTTADPHLADESVDVILLVDAYHEFSHPVEMMAGLVRALKPDGVLVLVEYRAEDPEVRIHRLHKMSQEQARREMRAAGLVWRETLDVLPQQHLMLFGKPESGELSSPLPR
ncbi:MAG: methyltransferase domain-containing protein [Deltaproteobacteria bacterium]|nr:MAG: methyltransferase domain-containing protein [Deltaproteobacteria bacterium]